MLSKFNFPCVQNRILTWIHIQVGCYALMIIVPIFQLLWYRYENQRREKHLQNKHGQPKLTKLDFSDKSDFEQWETFRYTM